MDDQLKLLAEVAAKLYPHVTTNPGVGGVGRAAKAVDEARAILRFAMCTMRLPALHECMALPCTKCGAQPDVPCVAATGKTKGKPLGFIHHARFDACVSATSPEAKREQDG